MKKFRFRLDRVLQLRARAERERARALGQALRDEEARRRSLEEAAARFDRCGEQIAEKSNGIVHAGTLRNLRLTVKAAADDVEAAVDEHKAAEASVQEEQERFGVARMERRIVERLREQRQEAWNIEASREEQGEIDGVALQRHAREERS
jgi:flagellar export protein FliJ